MMRRELNLLNAWQSDGQSMFNYGANQSTIKEMNRRLVFDVLNTMGKCSRTRIATITGLTKTTITNITNEMINEGIIVEAEATGSGVGRKQILLEVSSDSSRAIGISINRDRVCVSLVNLRGEILYATNLKLTGDDSSEEFLDLVISGCDSALEANGNHKVLGIGVASIGPLDADNGVILEPQNFGKISNVHIVQLLSERYKMQVILENDMNASAIAERMFGCGRKYSNFIYLGVTKGVGAGLFIDGNLFKGSNGHAGDVGHISIDYKGRLCECGNRGCLEMYASIPAIEKEASDWLPNKTNFQYSNGIWETIVFEARRGHEEAYKLIMLMVEYLAVALVTLCNVYDPQVIILGHEVVEAEDMLLCSLNSQINSKGLSKKNAEVEVIISHFGSEIGHIAGASIIIYQFVNNGAVD